MRKGRMIAASALLALSLVPAAAHAQSTPRPEVPDVIKAPAGEQQPDLPPIARRRELVAPRDRWPRSFQGIGELRSEGTSHRPQLPRRGDP